MKIAHIILLISAFAAPVLLHAQEQSTAPAQTNAKEADVSEALKAVEKRKAELKSGVDTRLPWEKKAGIERHRMLSVIKGSRKIDVRPVKRGDGINTGLVIAYGHVMQPPFKLEHVGNTFVVNGVQVSPSLILEREGKMKKKSASPGKNKEMDIQETAQELYSSGIQTKSLERVQAEILELIKEYPNVYEDPVWVDRKSLRTKFTGSQISVLMQFSGQPRLSEEEKNRQATERAQKSHASYMSLIRKPLERGHTIVFLSNGSMQTIADFKVKAAQVNQIMSTPGTNEQRIEKLHAAGFDYDFSEDIVENYLSSEWQLK